MAAEFGTTPWFCRQCNDFTNRRILPVDLNRVPHDDCPESWGRRDDWFALVREQRRLERRTAPHPPRGALPPRVLGQPPAALASVDLCLISMIA